MSPSGVGVSVGVVGVVGMVGMVGVGGTSLGGVDLLGVLGEVFDVGVVGVAGVGSTLAKVPAFLRSSTLLRSFDTLDCHENKAINK
jgi:hypothetical protein